MEPRELVKEEILETKRSASQKLSLGYLHVAVRQKMGMKTRAETDPTLHQGHVSYAGDSGPANATRNRYTHTHTQRRYPFTRGSYQRTGSAPQPEGTPV